jgi:RNA polymerase sigma factor (sigma-70 family)
LLGLYSKGDQRSFWELAGRYRPDMLYYADSYVDNLEDAEDIVQEVFTEFIVMLHSGKYTEQGMLKHLLIRMTHSCVEDYFKRKKKRESIFIPLEVWLESSAEFLAVAEEPPAEGFTAEEMKIFRKLVHLLKPKPKKIVVMRYHGRHSFEDIAHHCGISTNSATKIFSRVMDSLRKRISKEIH